MRKLFPLLVAAAALADAPKPPSTEEALVANVATAKFADSTTPNATKGMQAAVIGVDPTTKGATAYLKTPAGTKEDGRAARNTVVSAPDRSAADKDLDPGRKPAEMLDFLDVRPGMKVEDLGAGGGYTTELIARSVGPSGAVYMQNDPRWLSFLKDALAERFTHPAMKDVVRAEIPFDDPVPPEAKDLDLVVMNVIYHDIVNMPVDRARMNKIIFNALRPGGA